MNIARRCRTKVRYRDIKEAKEARYILHCYSERERVPCRYYECPHCQGFHLTSKPLA
jgi:hypothetical protein